MDVKHALAGRRRRWVLVAAAAGHSSLLFALPGRGESTEWDVSPDRRLALAYLVDGSLEVWDLALGRQLTRQSAANGDPTVVEHALAGNSSRSGPRYSFNAAFVGDGSRVLSWFANGTARVWQAASGREAAPLAKKSDCCNGS